MEQFAFPMGMVKVNNLRICHIKVCPPGIYLDVIWEEERLIFINGTVYNFISGADGNAFFFPVSV